MIRQYSVGQNNGLLTCEKPLGSLSRSTLSTPVGCGREGEEESTYSVQVSVNSSEVNNTYW